MRAGSGSVSLAATVDAEDCHDFRIVEVKKDSPFANPEAMLPWPTLQAFDVTYLSCRVTLQCLEDTPLYAAIQVLKITPPVRKEFHTAVHMPRRWRASSSETVSPFSARAASNSAAVCASTGSSSDAS